jgi:hypothetical protein
MLLVSPVENDSLLDMPTVLVLVPVDTDGVTLLIVVVSSMDECTVELRLLSIPRE